MASLKNSKSSFLNGILFNIFLVTLLVSMAEGLFIVINKLAGGRHTIDIETLSFLGLFIGVLIGLIWSLKIRIRLGEWLGAHPEWIWGVIALITVSFIIQNLALVLPASYYNLATKILVYTWPVVVFHAIINFNYWRRVCRYLLVQGKDNKVGMFVLTPLIFVPLFYLLLYRVNELLFDVTISNKYIYIDILFQLLTAYFILSISRNTILFLLTQLLLMSILYIGNGVKLSYLGGPLVPDDLASFKELLNILYGRDFYLVMVPLGLLGILLAVNFRIRKFATPIALCCGLLLVLTINFAPNLVLKPLDSIYGNVVWNQAKNYYNRGATVNIVQEFARRYAVQPPIPDRSEVAGALRELSKTNISIDPPLDMQSRNVYFIILESFWDSSILPNTGLDGEPFHSDFMDIWQRAGKTKAMSPMILWGTANSEFELMCGMPHNPTGVMFQNEIQNYIPCLPELLSEAGYHTYAFHPNIPAFWNRNNTYPRLGFDEYFSKSSFVMDDLNGNYLSDESTLNQVLAILDTRQNEAPMLVYILSISGHYSYQLNIGKRPFVLKADDENVEAYANSTWYTSKETARFIERVLSADSDAIIVVVGDHLPFLGSNYHSYIQAGLFDKNESDSFDGEMTRTMTSTPLLIIDGERGPRAVGTVPMYQVPMIVMDMLEANQEVWMELFAAPDELRVRPVGKDVVLIDPDDSTRICKAGDDSPDCKSIHDWRRAVQLLVNDITIGRQYSFEEQDKR